MCWGTPPGYLGPQCLLDRTSSLVAVSLFLTEKVDMCGYHAWRMYPCLHDDTGWLCRGGEIEKHHPSACFCLRCWEYKPAEEKHCELFLVVDGLCKISYHDLLELLFCSLSISSKVQNVLTTELSMTSRVSSARSSGLVLVNRFLITIITIANCLLVRGTFFVTLLVIILGVSILLLKIQQEARLLGPCNQSLLESLPFCGVFSLVFSSSSP